MKKVSSYIFLTVMLAVQLCGCGADGKEASGVPDAAQGADASGALETDGEQDAGLSGGQGIFAGSGGVLDPAAVSDLAGKDNSLDAYSAAARVSLQAEKPENAIEGGGEGSCLSVSGAYHFKKHIFQSLAEYWEELFL